MSGTDLVLFNASVSVPAPLSIRLRSRPFNVVFSVIVDGPPGTVELQIRPSLLGSLGGGMSIEYHSRQPMPGAVSELPDCEVLGSVTCYPDGMTLGTQSTFERWFRARDGQSIIDELVRRHQANTWTLDDGELDVATVLGTLPGAAGQLPTGEVSSWD